MLWKGQESIVSLEVKKLGKSVVGTDVRASNSRDTLQTAD